MRASAEFEPASPELVTETFEYLESRLGIGPDALVGFRLWARPGSPSVWIASDTTEPGRSAVAEAIGLVLMRHPPPRGFPTTEFIQRFGHLATAQVVRVTDEQALRLMKGEQLSASEAGVGDDLVEGIVVVTTALSPLGRGWFREGQLRVDFPKARSIRLRGLSLSPDADDPAP